ncbi:uncharacterized protein [Amphiura filiformis]|uniref:uncharacterized protein n=1 Tax=Amphiura filiformis TaxID=82378 RepID=UPI003B214C6D
MTKNIHSFVKDNFGRECLQDVRSYEKTARKIANYRNHLRFNLRCLHEHITPRSIKLKSNVSGHKADTILENAERKLLNERVRQVNFTIDVLNRKKDQLSEKLSGSLSSDAYNRVAEFTTHAQLSQHEQVSSIGSVTYNLAKHAAKILGPLVGRSPHHIKNTQDFVNQIKDLKLSESEIITSYDVTALFTCIPPDFALKVVKECLESDNTLSERTNLKVEQIVELVEICLNTTYFSYKGKYFKQQHGCAMGSPVSPIVVNLCMESFEQQALKSYPGTKPRVWLRFVDDTFVILNRSELDGFFEHINSVDDNIKFTQELCKDNTLAFLDCLISVQSDGTLTSKVYRKPTHTDHYLQFGSHHPLVHKLGVIRTLQYRADTIISDSEQVPEEKDHIKTALNNCGYPDWAFLKATKSKEPKTGGASGQTNRARVTIPYISGISERVKNHFKSFGISTSFKPVNTLRGKLVNVKDKQPKDKRSNLVYGVVCGDTDCSAAYVGETKQALKPALVNIGDQVPTKRKTLLFTSI